MNLTVTNLKQTDQTSCELAQHRQQFMGQNIEI